MINREYSEQWTFQLHWAYQQSRPILEGIEIGHSQHSQRWSAVSLEIPRQDQYFSGGSSSLRCFSLITCSGPPYSRYSTTSAVGLARAESLPLLMPRLLSQVLEHLGFLEDPRIERRIKCPQILSLERSLVMPISFLLQQQDQEEVPDEVAEDPPRRDDPVLEVEVEVARSPVPDISPPSPPPPPSATAPADTPAHHIQRSILRSMFMLVRGSSQLLWMLSVHLPLHRRRRTRDWPEPRPL